MLRRSVANLLAHRPLKVNSFARAGLVRSNSTAAAADAAAFLEQTKDAVESGKLALQEQQVQKMQQSSHLGPVHILNVTITRNNAIYNLSKLGGQTVFTFTNRMAGFRHFQKRTAGACEEAATIIAKRIVGMRPMPSALRIKIKGERSFRASFFKGLRTKREIVIESIEDCTPIPFNGCKARKDRRK